MGDIAPLSNQESSSFCSNLNDPQFKLRKKYLLREVLEKPIDEQMELMGNSILRKYGKTSDTGF